ncbi:MAG: phosphoribosylanthranilate isomerase [Lachnospiraceae bacterium]|nr:phosphoribosylanthranilate isomerase [Lachnospiraceae bacterium]
MKQEDIRKVNELQPDFAGFVFAHTRHFVTHEQAREMKALLDPKIQAVGVFVDAPEEEVIGLLNAGIIDLAQLHGSETDETVARIQNATGKRVIKACIMKDEDSVKQAVPDADYLLYDAGKGEGRTFNWEWLKESPEKPFFLAGGLTPENVAEGIRAVQPWAVDVSSAVEDEDLSKNYEKMKRFIEAARSVRYEG